VKPKAYMILQAIEESYYKITISGMLMLSKLLIIRLEARAVRYSKLYIVEEQKPYKVLRQNSLYIVTVFRNICLRASCFYGVSELHGAVI
jgi:hypothetical protein